MATDNGPESYGRFDLGDNRDSALTIWKQLQGDASLTQATLLQMEWMEADTALPLEIRIKGCTLQQHAYNCALITKELFRTRNLKASSHNDL
jgi:hypothetical protein